MKIFRGNAKTRAVSVQDGNDTHELEPPASGFGWGSSDGKAHALAYAILRETLGDEARAELLASRFKWRVIKMWAANNQWSISEQMVLQTVADIEKVAADTAGARSQMARERPAFQVDALPAGTSWSSNPKIKPNRN